MKKLWNPAAAAVIAVALAGTTGYCTITTRVDPLPPPPPAVSPPVRLLPEAIEPFPPIETEQLDDAG